MNGGEERAGAVSYTHLDVYKRQDENHLAAVRPSSPCRFWCTEAVCGPVDFGALFITSNEKTRTHGGAGFFFSYGMISSEEVC